MLRVPDPPRRAPHTLAARLCTLDHERTHPPTPQEQYPSPVDPPNSARPLHG